MTNIGPCTPVVEIPLKTDDASNGSPQLVRAKVWHVYGPPAKGLPGWETWGTGGVIHRFGKGV